MTTVAVIHNGSKPRESLDRFRAKLAHEVRVYETGSGSDIVEQTKRAISAGANVLVASGGDGTLLGVLNANAEVGLPIAILPLGVGNDFAHELGVHDIDGAVAAINGGRTVPADIGLAAYRADGREQRTFFCSTAGAGAIARVFELERGRAGALKRVLGNAIWPLLTLQSFLSSPLTAARVTIDDRTIELRLSTFELSKVRLSGGQSFTPDARIEGRGFEIWTFETRGLGQFLIFARRLFRGDRTHLELNYVRHFRDVRRTMIESDVPLCVHLNGELVGTTPASFEITDAPMSFFRP